LPHLSNTTRHEDYAKSINARRGIEKVFGWIQQWGGLRQFKLCNLLKPAMAAA
jgi:hypothetical protein